eukprot:4676709-Ditylum_brightwellii.AAC.1
MEKQKLEVEESRIEHMLTCVQNKMKTTEEEETRLREGARREYDRVKEEARREYQGALDVVQKKKEYLDEEIDIVN